MVLSSSWFSLQGHHKDKVSKVDITLRQTTKCREHLILLDVDSNTCPNHWRLQTSTPQDILPIILPWLIAHMSSLLNLKNKLRLSLITSSWRLQQIWWDTMMSVLKTGSKSIKSFLLAENTSLVDTAQRLLQVLLSQTSESMWWKWSCQRMNLELLQASLQDISS